MGKMQLSDWSAQVKGRDGKCRNCGYEPSHAERRGQGLEFDGSELKEVTREEKKPDVKSAGELMIASLYRAGRSGRTWKQCVGIFFDANKRQGTTFRVPKEIRIGGHRYAMLRAGSEDGGRKVAQLFPFTVNKGHGGEYEIANQPETAGAAF